jgi:hypothetical protein
MKNSVAVEWVASFSHPSPSQSIESALLGVGEFNHSNIQGLQELAPTEQKQCFRC